MIHRTLHTYILRELLRIFFLTASALTTLMAFGGMFRPLTKQGIDVGQLMVVLINLMPAMLAYAIPISALFAAVLVYWRMSTDNELTACRAGGISFISIVLPAFILGLVVASVDLVFLNYVVPQFLQRTERAVFRDLGSLLVAQIGRQEKFQYDKLVVIADSAELQPEDDSGNAVVILRGMAGSWLENGRPSATAVAQEATLTIHGIPGSDSVEIDVALKNATGFDHSEAMRRISGSVDSLSPDGRPIRFPSFVKSKPKFMNWRDLDRMTADPYLFPPVAEMVDRIETANDFETIAMNVENWWRHNRGPRGEIVLEQTIMRGATSQLVVIAPNVAVDPKAARQESLSFVKNDTKRVTIEEWILETKNSVTSPTLATTHTCDSATLLLSVDTFTGTGIKAALRLEGGITMENHALKIKPKDTKGPVMIANLVLPQNIRPPAHAAPEPGHLAYGVMVKDAEASGDQSMQILGKQTRDRINKLNRTITSELHSRGSFSLSCLTLVLLGAALGILLKGQNPLAVFVMGFVPAILLVLLITAGRQVTEGQAQNMNLGLSLIWAGNAVLLAMVASAYGVLLRK